MKRPNEMDPWRRAVHDSGLTLTQIATATGRSINTVYAYSKGQRRAPADWQASVIDLCQALSRLHPDVVDGAVA